MDLIIRAALVGIGATLLLDLWGLLARRAFGLPMADYAMVGRWLGHMPAGRYVHRRIADAPAVPGERVIGWAAHYATGVIFAGLLVAAFGESWTREPTPGPAAAVGILTVAVPFFIMQPGMGLGLAASKAPRPNLARLRSLVTHIVFGAGLYAAAWLLARLMA